MKLTVLAQIAYIVAGVSASQYPEFASLLRRQQPGTPQYECHANCGGVMTAARSDDFCDSSDFNTAFSACMECALEYDVWKYYRSAVSNAATECGLDATPAEPSPSSVTATGSDPSTGGSSPSSTSQSRTTEPAEPTETGTSSIRTSTAIPTAASSSANLGGSSSATPSSPVFTGGAALDMPAGMIAGSLLPAIAAFL